MPNALNEMFAIRMGGYLLNGMRQANRLAVEFDVGELGVLQWPCVRSRESVSAFIFRWHFWCYGWLVEFTCDNQILFRDRWHFAM